LSTSPLVVAPKATAPLIRLCGDYRPVNPYVRIRQEPIPHVQQSIAKAAGWKDFVDLDMTNSFHQIPIDHPSSELLSVSTPWGLYRPLFLPEGVGPASGILQSVVRSVFADFEPWIIVIFDNFLILASDYADATAKLEQVLIRCKKHRLVLKMKKSWIGTDVVTFFGYEVRPGSWSLSQSRKDAISTMIFPTTQKQMQSFLGAANFFHTHIPNYASWASSLYECTAAGFNWTESTWAKDYRALFDLFKTAIMDSVTLHFPDYSLPWIIRSDSSDHAVGAVLFQMHSSSPNAVIHQPIAFASKKYSGAALNWDTFKKEAFALYFAVTKF
jgi:RNase H-like domain found in reverse transcriptase